MSRDAAVRRALADNRDLIAVGVGREAARGRVDQAILKPNPALEAGAQSDLITGNTGARKLDLGLAQAIPLGNRLHEAQLVARVCVFLASCACQSRSRCATGLDAEI